MPNNEDLNSPAHASDSADKHAHGAHGKSLGKEHLVDDANVEPGSAEGEQRGADAWGSEQSGGSVIDKRRDDHRG